jgi:hypothetical protein
MSPPPATHKTPGYEAPLGFSSPHAPAAAEFNSDLYLAWTANDATSRIYLASSADGRAFAGVQALSCTSSSAPSLAEFKNKLYMVWRANDASNSIYLTSSPDANRWLPAQKLDFTTPKEPVLVALPAALYLAWTANDPSHQLYAASSDDGAHWSLAWPMEGHFSEESPTLFVDGGRVHAVAPEGPLGGRLFMTDSADGRIWTVAKRLAYSSPRSPGIVIGPANSHLAFAEADSPHEIHFGVGSKPDWTDDHHRIGLESPARVTAVKFKGKVRLFWRGMSLWNDLRTAEIS